MEELRLTDGDRLAAERDVKKGLAEIRLLVFLSRLDDPHLVESPVDRGFRPWPVWADCSRTLNLLFCSVKTLAHSVADKQSKMLSLIVEDRCSVSQLEPQEMFSFSTCLAACSTVAVAVRSILPP